MITVIYDHAKARWPRASRVCNFGIIGVLGFIVDTSILYLGLWLRFEIIASRVASFLVAATVTWWLNRQFTFSLNRPPNLKEWCAYLLANSIGSFINLSVFTGMVTLIHGYPPFLAVAVGSVCGMAINFTLSSQVMMRFKNS